MVPHRKGQHPLPMQAFRNYPINRPSQHRIASQRSAAHRVEGRRPTNIRGCIDPGPDQGYLYSGGGGGLEGRPAGRPGANERMNQSVWVPGMVLLTWQVSHVTITTLDSGEMRERK